METTSAAERLNFASLFVYVCVLIVALRTALEGVPVLCRIPLAARSLDSLSEWMTSMTHTDELHACYF